jgi:integrase
VLTRTLAKLLREHRLASPHKTPADFVFANTLGRPFDYRDAEGFRKAVKAAGLQAPGKLTLHSLRHGFASLLIAKGLNVVFLSRRLGHANLNVTLEVYAHLFEHADHSTAPEQRWKQAARRSTRQRP